MNTFDYILGIVGFVVVGIGVLMAGGILFANAVEDFKVWRLKRTPEYVRYKKEKEEEKELYELYPK